MWCVSGVYGVNGSKMMNKSKYEETRGGESKSEIIFANARKMSKNAEISTLKVKFRYAMIEIDMSIYLVNTHV